MTYYVEIKPLNGRQDYYRLVKDLDDHGLTNVEYFPGGWQDQVIYSVLPHLKFEDEEEALIYILAFGGKLSKELPIKMDL